MTRPAFAHRTLSELDHVRIGRLVAGARSHAGEDLNDLLDDADIVPAREVPHDVVTMNTRAVVEDLDDGSRRTLTLAYPEDADPAAGSVSVLSPIGTALLGSRRGEQIEWTTPVGAVHRLRVVELLFQPEASGDYTM